MRKLTALAIAVIAPAMIAGCGSLGGPAAHLDEGKVLVAAEGAFDAAVVASAAPIRSGLLAPATKARMKALADRGEAYVTAARAAYAAGDAAQAATQTAALGSLAAQIDALAGQGGRP